MMLKTNAFLSLFKAATQRPRVRKWFWLQVYELLPLFTDSSLDFMNYGYAPLDESEHKLEISPEDEPNRYGIWLYQQLLQSVEVQDQRVLEVGCGRGGGSAFIRSYYCPREVVGVDYSKRAVALCKKSHSAPGLTFVRSEAEKLAFDAGQFDLVVNVESSHCYPSWSSFLAEVVRVLRTGGYFLFADFRHKSEVEPLFVRAEQAGMSVAKRSDITANVVAALSHDSDRRRQFIRSRMPRILWKPVEQFAAVEGTVMYENLRSGQFRYVSSVMQKT